jgi:HlyD family secretion protein
VEVEHREALIVPLSAVAYDGANAFVQVVADDKVSSRPITVGLIDGRRAEVTDGLTRDESVVVKAGTFLRDGDKIKPVAAETQSAAQP